MGIKGYGGVVRLKAARSVKEELSRKLIPIENKSSKYSATVNTQLNLPLSTDLSIPMTTERLRQAYGGKLSEMELAAIRPVMLNAITAIKHSMYTGVGYATIAHSSKILSPFLWDVIMLWLRRCGFTVHEDSREVVLVEDCQNQGRTRVKLLFGAKIFWSRKVEDQVKILEGMKEKVSYDGLA